MLSREVVLDNIADRGGDAVRGENIAALANVNSVSGSERAGGKRRSGSKGFDLNHYPDLLKE
jgi:hypothetical protein